MPTLHHWITNYKSTFYLHQSSDFHNFLTLHIYYWQIINACRVKLNNIWRSWIKVNPSQKIFRVANTHSLQSHDKNLRENIKKFEEASSWNHLPLHLNSAFSFSPVRFLAAMGLSILQFLFLIHFIVSSSSSLQVIWKIKQEKIDNINMLDMSKSFIKNLKN